uniref:Integrase catalytic domain-containing protein n=1 Tax=Daphnia galeata TaxID=27404 RepID=A0A8J2RYA9_9CRUS|nr:unnamed protein product [Daphnia galeata]
MLRFFFSQPIIKTLAESAVNFLNGLSNPQVPQQAPFQTAHHVSHLGQLSQPQEPPIQSPLDRVRSWGQVSNLNLGSSPMFLHGHNPQPASPTDKGYNVPKIARLLNLAPWRIKYVMRKAGLKSRQFSEISNLECVVSEIVSKILLANLKVAARLGLKVSLDRLRESFCRVKVIRSDPPRRTIKRRVYSVPGPLSLWHVDSHHKLSRWNFYVQGCDDGFSRLMVVLNLSSSNRAKTTLSLFLDAVAKWGLPMRVRSDHGTENYGVCDFMLVARSDVTNPFMAGKSVHNQRIERSWRDVFETALEPFHTMYI